MPLEFRGLAIIDPPGRGIRFAGYPMSTRNVPLAICEATADALRIIAGLAHASIDELMGIFELHKANYSLSLQPSSMTARIVRSSPRAICLLLATTNTLRGIKNSNAFMVSFRQTERQRC
jgi:hypothetical protein